MNKTQKKWILGVFCGAVLLFVAVFALMQWQKTKHQDTAQTEKKSVQATATAVPTATPDPHAGKVQSSLNGSYVSPKTEAKRPFAIMINNIEYAFDHQMGVSKADVVYEALAEGGITRMMAIYQDVSKVKKIGSVRSARHYYVQFAYEWDAIFCHFGQTKYAISKMKKLKTDNLSGLSAIGPVVYRRNYSIRAPHNVFTSGKKMIKGAKKLKYSLKKDETKSAKHFSFNETDTDLAAGEKGKQITLPFSYYSTAKLKYDKKNKVYLKYEYKKKHKDGYYKKQLAFKNVIVQFVKEKNKDHNGYQTMDLTNTSGSEYYLTNGKKVKIRWTRNEKSHEMVYLDASGNTLSINPGKTYIAVYPTNRKKLIKIQ